MHIFYPLQPVLISGLETMESELLHEMKKMNGALGKQPKVPIGDCWMEGGDSGITQGEVLSVEIKVKK